VNKKALLHLQKDPILFPLVKKHGIITTKTSEDIFLDIIETIINQQLSGKVAETIFTRFKKLFGNKIINPIDVINSQSEAIRTVGISNSKVSYIKNVALAIHSGSINLKKLKRAPDAVVAAELTKIKGIGKWSAEMILMFSLGRKDVFSIGDLGLRVAVSRLYSVDRNDLMKIEEISLQWKPYRTYASRILWKSLEEK